MAFDGNGNYNPPAPEYPLQPQTVISSADMNTIILDIASALGNCMTRDSQGSPSVDLNLFTKKIINLGAATNPNDAMRKVDVETYAITATTDRDMAGFRLKNIPASPTAGTDAVSADYVNTAQVDRTMDGHHLLGAPAGPYAAAEYIPKQYVDDQDALKASLSGATYTGAQNFTGATVTVPTQTYTDSSTKAASTAFVQSVAFSATLPGLAGNALKFLRVNAGESSAEWARVDTYGGRDVRTSNTVLGAADIGKLIDITSGTFSQTFTAAATLGSHWFCYLRNSGTGDITLDPDSSELIDGLTSYVMYPGETRLVTCDGTGFYSIVLTSFNKTFTATGSFVKPPGYEMFSGIKWGAGGGGAGGAGGQGGGCSQFDFPASAIGATQAVTIGAGGVAGADGGHTTFIFTSQGGGKGNTANGGCAYGSSLLAAPFPNDAAIASQNYAVQVNAFYGGGTDLIGQQHLGFSVYGGAAGRVSGGAATSIFGGAGGVGSGSGVAPGGGGGSTGAGARGELRIWGVL